MTDQSTVDELLEKNKNQHELVLIVAFNKNGKIHIDTNRPSFEFVNYALNRATYSINHLETTEVLQREMSGNEPELVKVPPVTEAEIAVATQVANDTLPKKRGRKPKNA